MPLVCAALLVSLIGGAVWWVSRGTSRVSEGWETLVATPGFDRWAKRVKDPRSGIIFILVEPGRFMMGSPDGEGFDHEHPQHEVRITKPFYLAETETTVAQWRRFVEATGHENTGQAETDQHPVSEVNWEDAKALCEYYGYRLPTEAEWEYACRAGTTGQLYGSLDEIAWHGDNTGSESHPVAEKKPNPWGFYDMLGNLWEWCADAYDQDFYRKEVRDDPFVADGPWRVVRGGSWFYHPTGVRVADRIAYLPQARVTGLGFRCARSLGKIGPAAKEAVPALEAAARDGVEGAESALKEIRGR